MVNLKIRKAGLEDLGTIQALSQELFEHDKKWDEFLNMNWSYGKYGEKYFTGFFTSKNKICFIAEVDQKAVGYLTGKVLPVQSWRPTKRTEATNLFVKEEFRGMLVGTELIKEFFAWSKQKGVKQAVVVTNAKNEKAQKFYKKNNFIPQHITLEAEL